MNNTCQHSPEKLDFSGKLADIIADACARSEAASEPSWAADTRKAGACAFRTLPHPTQKDEAWRRTNPDLFSHFYENKPRISAGEVFSAEAGNVTAATPQTSCCETKCTGVCALPLAEAFKTEDFKDLFFQAELHQKESLAALNAACCNGGAYIAIPQNFSAEKPIIVRHEVHNEQDGSAYLPHSVIAGKAGSKAVVLEQFTSKDFDLLAVPEIEINLEPNASLQYVCLLDFGSKTNCAARIHTALGRDSSLKLLVIGIGGKTTKTFVINDLNAPGADSQVFGLVYSDNKQHFDIDIVQNHHAPGASSDVLFNCALDGESRTVFSGNIFVDPVAQKTSAYQKNRNLLLSDKAKADSMPKLEILADDVACTHGASFATYDADQKFYLQSRGINEQEARRLIVAGFFQEVIERLDCPDLAERLSAIMQERFENSESH